MNQKDIIFQESRISCCQKSNVIYLLEPIFETRQANKRFIGKQKNGTNMKHNVFVCTPKRSAKVELEFPMRLLTLNMIIENSTFLPFPFRLYIMISNACF